MEQVSNLGFFFSFFMHKISLLSWVLLARNKIWLNSWLAKYFIACTLCAMPKAQLNKKYFKPIKKLYFKKLGDNLKNL